MKGARAGVCLTSGKLPDCKLGANRAANVTTIAKDVALLPFLAKSPELSTFQLATLRAAATNATLLDSELLGRVRATGRTSYVATSNKASTRADASAQAAAILALIAAQSKTADAVTAGAAVLATGLEPSFSAAVTAIALARADTTAESATPDLAVKVSAASKTLLDAAFTSADSPVVTKSTPFEALSASSNLTAVAEGSGTAVVTTLLEYVPLQLPTSATYGGLYVTRVTRSLNATTDLAAGAPLATIPLAATVVVTVQVHCPTSPYHACFHAGHVLATGLLYASIACENLPPAHAVPAGDHRRRHQRLHCRCADACRP